MKIGDGTGLIDYTCQSTLPREVKPVRRVCLSAPLIIQRVSHEIDIIYSFTFPAAVLVF